MDKLILFLIRKKLGVRKYEGFQFTNQRSSKDIYFFTDKGLMKFTEHGLTMPSKVSLNWLVDKRCKVEGDQGDFSFL